MSQHDVEDLVEDSIRLVLASSTTDEEKRALTRQLYRFQAMFDTSDTYGRLKTELDVIGYKSGGEEQEDSRPLPMIATMMRMADAAGDIKLAYSWLAMLVEATSEYQITEELPQTFAALIADADAQEIREIALRLNLPKAKPKHPYLKLRSWASAKPFRAPRKEREVEYWATLRYFADLAAPLEKIEAEQKKHRIAAAGRQNSPFSRVPELGIVPGELSFLRREATDDVLRLIFALEKSSVPGGGTSFFVLEQELNLRLIVGEFWIISGDIARWQGREDATHGPVHFRYNYFFLVPEKELKTTTQINALGGWMYKPTQPEKVLRERIANIFSFWPKRERVLRFHRQSLAAELRALGPEKALKNAIKMGNRHGFFRTDIELMFALACVAIEDGAELASHIERIETRLGTIHPNNPLRAHWTEGLAHIKSGKLWFPQELSLVFRHCTI